MLVIEDARRECNKKLMIGFFISLFSIPVLIYTISSIFGDNTDPDVPWDILGGSSLALSIFGLGFLIYFQLELQVIKKVEAGRGVIISWVNEYGDELILTPKRIYTRITTNDETIRRTWIEPSFGGDQAILGGAQQIQSGEFPWKALIPDLTVKSKIKKGFPMIHMPRNSKLVFKLIEDDTKQQLLIIWFAAKHDYGGAEILIRFMLPKTTSLSLADLKQIISHYEHRYIVKLEK